VKNPLSQEMVVSSDSVFASALTRMLDGASRLALDFDQPAESRVEAIHSLALGSYSQSGDVLVQLISSRQPHVVAVAAIQSLGRYRDVAAAKAIINVWGGLTPQLRGAATEVLFARRERLEVLLAAVGEGTIRPSQLNPDRIQFLLSHGDPQIRGKAFRMLGGEALARREEAVAAYRDALDLSGKTDRGRIVFRRECSKCHRLEGVGYDLGLPLKAIKDRGREGILLNVLDPNRNVNPQYANYVVVTDDGLSITGMITAETANSITLRRAEGESDTVLRVKIDELVDTGMSIMPEGLEKRLTKQDMADLLEYLMSVE
jgi:putative heme-binding domain-containing protein